jgi:hypothetical protein
MSDATSCPESGRKRDEFVYEHRVRALLRKSEGSVDELYTEWDNRRDWTISTAVVLDERGFTVQIESRPIHETVDFEEVPR